MPLISPLMPVPQLLIVLIFDNDFVFFSVLLQKDHFAKQLCIVEQFVTSML